MIDLKKPIRIKRHFLGESDSCEAKYLGQSIAGNHVVDDAVDGVEKYTAEMLERYFENIPAEPPKLSGFIEIYSTAKNFKNHNIESVWENRLDVDFQKYKDENFWLTIDLSQVPAHAIVKVAP
jgi:hypothetical protein